MKNILLVLLALSFLISQWSIAADSAAPAPMKADQIKQLVSDMSVVCVKEKDRSTCLTYMAADGSVKRLTHSDSKVRKGNWHTDDKDRLCILWEGKKKPLCLAITQMPNMTYTMHRKGKVKSTIIALIPGDKVGNFPHH